MLLFNYNRGFKDELVTTALLFALTMTGSFFFVSRNQEPNKKKTTETILGLATSEPQPAPAVVAPTAIPMSTPTSTPIVAPSTAPEATTSAETDDAVEIPYGSSQDFENDKYKISFQNPRLIVTDSRRFEVTVVIANKSVEGEGLTNKLSAKVTLDGETITETAPLTISETKKISVGQKLTFVASLSLMDQTELTIIRYNPGNGLLTVDYNL